MTPFARKLHVLSARALVLRSTAPDIFAQELVRPMFAPDCPQPWLHVPRTSPLLTRVRVITMVIRLDLRRPCSVLIAKGMDMILLAAAITASAMIRVSSADANYFV